MPYDTIVLCLACIGTMTVGQVLGTTIFLIISKIHEKIKSRKGK